MGTDADTAIELLESLTPLWWQGAIVFFLLGDSLTTFVGYQMHTVVEASPVAAWFISTYGILLLVPVKVAVVCGFYGLYRVTPRPHDIGVPLGLCALGFVVTVWNSAVIVAALL
ncbi:hypothetical protein D3D02_03260 [Halobellus sp. Atlit-38R]|jgi:hypothetical protein|uniref:hypothetical protein n=1 Tax=Halobellus sp. Atlit-38R TaxID=2282131 RepID=UPI000EF2266C|nr:hypothetical protein [Halobellus sp. Atlit-38R]RLM90795.1 hypothetical protein D3D02_03260 [Halobellus sp. Atlit-38R]